MAGTPESLHVWLENQEICAMGEYILRRSGVQGKNVPEIPRKYGTTGTVIVNVVMSR